MKNGISLVDLARRIEENKSLKADFVAPASSLRMVVVRDSKPGLFSTVSNGPQVPAIRPIAHGQIGTYLGIPKPYYDRMLDKDPALLADNVNRWFRDTGDRRMLRTMAGDLRAFMSDRYHRIENEEIAEAVLPVLMEAGVTIRSCEVTEKRMSIVALLPRVRAEVKVGDIVEAGVRVGNSEVGFGAASVSPFVHRLVCLNGMTVPDRKLSARHVGRRIQEGGDLNAIFSDEAKRADDRAIMLKVRDVVRHALDESAFKASVDKMTKLTEGRVTGDPVKAVEVLAQKVGANDKEKGGILRSLIEGGDLSAWGMLNAVTAQAHTVDDYDRGLDLTEAGGKLLDLPKGEWKQILEAA
jgi:hypothetical protein